MPRIGGESVLGRLSELMFLHVVRRYLEGLPPEQTDWLAGLRDEPVGRALAALHRNPARAWTLQSLAREAGIVALGVGGARSRSSWGIRQSSTSRAGACSSRPISFAVARRALRRSPIAWATSPRRRLVGRSRKRLGHPRASGVSDNRLASWKPNVFSVDHARGP